MKKLTIIITMFLMTACAPRPMPQPLPTPEPEVRTITILPVSIVTNDKQDKKTRQGLTAGKMELNRLLHDYFKNNDRVHFLSPDQTATYNQGYETKEEVQKLGRRLHSDALMIWEISRYREKDGGNYSVGHPSSVAFSYHLVSTATGATLCGDKIDHTQEPLTENLLSIKTFLKRGGKWVSAARLMSDILPTTLKQCKYLKADKNDAAGQ